MSLPSIVLLSMTVMFTCAVPDGFAQPAPGRVEIGGGATIHRLTESHTTTAGVTGRFSFDLTNWLAADAELTFFPDDDITIRSTLAPDFALGHHRRRTDGFVGVKIGRRASRFGVFGRLRPGFTHLTDQGMSCSGEPCTRILVPRNEYRTEFALDIGGGFEFYPSARTVTRVDLGDTIIRHRSFAPPCPRGCTSQNFTMRIGAGFRF